MISHRDSIYGLKNKKRHGKAFKIILFILVCLLIAGGILLAKNYNTVALMLGKGNINFKTISQAEKSLSETGKFGKTAVTVSTNQTQVLSSISRDNAVALTVTQKTSGKQIIDAKVNVRKINFSGIDKNALKHGNPAAIKAAKALANSYIGNLINPNDLTGLEIYLAASLLSQYKTNPTNVNINHNFGNAHLTLTGNISTGKVEVSITK